MVQKFLKNLFFSDKNKGPTEKNSVDFLGKQLGQKEISFNLHNQRVDDVAIPKADIVAAPEKITLSELTKIFKESNLTRLPIFRNTLDNPIG